MNEKATMVITHREGRILTALVRDNRLLQVQLEQPQALQVGEIYIGKVRNVVANIEAAFVDVGDGRLCFLPTGKLKAPLLTNRVYDGTLKAGDEIVVQITREALKTKEAACDTNLSFAGHFAVVTTGKKQIGFSNKLSKQQKQYLQELIGEHFSDFPYGLVIRTNAGMITEEKVLLDEIKSLVEEADNLLQYAKNRVCFSKLKEVSPLWLNAIRDTNKKWYDKIVTDDLEIYQSLQEHFQRFPEEQTASLTLHSDAMLSLSALYGLEGKLKEALDQKVWLKSGAYLVIEQTEALVSIDVNTGKNVKKRERSEQFQAINMEACEEIARQLMLRNLSGMILIDFINMDDKAQENQLLSHLKGLVAKDPVRTEVVDMTALGLVEMTRKKINKSLAEQLR